MTVSTITSKGQTTIPKEIRDEFHLKPHDKLIYTYDKDKIIIRPLAGNILDLRGTFPVKGRVNFEKARKRMEKGIAKEILEEMSW